MGYRTVNQKLLEHWLLINRPQALSKLAVKAQVSEATLGLARTGRVPSRTSTRMAIALAIGCDVDDLFPLSIAGAPTGDDAA